MANVINDVLAVMFFEDLKTFDQKHIDDVPFELIGSAQKGEATAMHDFQADGCVSCMLAYV